MLAVFKEMLEQLRVVVQTCNTCIIEIKQTNSSFFCITGIGWGHVKTEKVIFQISTDVYFVSC